MLYSGVEYSHLQDPLENDTIKTSEDLKKVENGEIAGLVIGSTTTAMLLLLIGFILFSQRSSRGIPPARPSHVEKRSKNGTVFDKVSQKIDDPETPSSIALPDLPEVS